MIIHGNTIISEDLFDKHFICDLNSCKGACCIEGDYGAPLTSDEVEFLEQELNTIKPFLSNEGLQVIEEKGVVERDKDGDLVTTCRTSGECSFAIYDQGVLACGIEKAFKAGATSFQKPVSCHLYPIRIHQVGDYEALNYHRWSICECARVLGKKEKMPVFRFLKQALIRRYGTEWYDELELIYKAYLAEN